MPRKAKSSDVEIVDEEKVQKKAKKPVSKKSESKNTKKAELKKVSKAEKVEKKPKNSKKTDSKSTKKAEPKKALKSEKTKKETKDLKKAVSKSTKKTEPKKVLKPEKEDKKIKDSKKTTTSKTKKAESKKTVKPKKEEKAKTKVTKAAKPKKVTKVSEKNKTVKAKSTKTKKVTSTKKTSKKSETSSKVTNKKVSATSKKSIKSKKTKSFLAEYYDLPYRYNETVVKILAQTPKKLFVYWDVSDQDIQKYLKVFGENFFYETYPVLLIHNQEMDYTFEVQVNDFANCWYVDINDAKCNYTVNLGRKFKNIEDVKIDQKEFIKENIDLKNDYLQISNSNFLEVPNDHILFEKLGNSVKYRNVKTLEEMEKKIKTIISEKGNKLEIYDIYNFYQEIYKNEIEENIFDINNPSSGNTSSKLQYR